MASEARCVTIGTVLCVEQSRVQVCKVHALEANPIGGASSAGITIAIIDAFARSKGVPCFIVMVLILDADRNGNAFTVDQNLIDGTGGAFLG